MAQPLPKRTHDERDRASQNQDGEREQGKLPLGQGPDSERVVDKRDVEERARPQCDEPGEEGASDRCECGADPRAQEPEPAIGKAERDER